MFIPRGFEEHNFFLLVFQTKIYGMKFNEKFLYLYLLKARFALVPHEEFKWQKLFNEQDAILKMLLVIRNQKMCNQRWTILLIFFFILLHTSYLDQGCPCYNRYIYLIFEKPHFYSTKV